VQGAIAHSLLQGKDFFSFELFQTDANHFVRKSDMKASHLILFNLILNINAKKVNKILLAAISRQVI
jgi:hypothetical protein